MNNSDVSADIEKNILTAHETYYSIHRGNGQFSMVSTHLYEKARHIVLDYSRGPASLQKFQKLIARLFPRLRFPGVARISFGLQTTNAEIDILKEVLNKIASKTTITERKETEKQIDEFVKAAAKRVYA